MIFVSDLYISDRIGGVEFLPTFSIRASSSNTLYYEFINDNEVHKNTVFSFSEYKRLKFYLYNDTDPTKDVLYDIIRLNMTVIKDRVILRTNYKVQYKYPSNQIFHMKVTIGS
ncbi:MAG: hypothetical protein ACTSRZ_17565 [Promethearchaeota archaeon]